MLCESIDSSTLINCVACEPQRVFPWHYLEAATSATLLLLVSSLPIATLEVGSCTRSISMWRAISFLIDIASVGIDPFAVIVLAGLLVMLLALGIGSMADTVFSSITFANQGRRIAASWGMLGFGIGMMALSQLAGLQLVGGVLELESLRLGSAVWVSIAGGLACGVIDLVRCAVTKRIPTTTFVFSSR